MDDCMRGFFVKICNWFFKGVDWFCRFLLVVEVLVISYVVISRYLFHASPRWGEELARLLLIWFGFISAALALRTDTHARITLFEKLLTDRGKKVLYVVNQVIIFLFSLFLLFSGSKIASTTARAILPGLEIARSWLYISLPVAGITYLMTVVEKLVKGMGQHE
jgi:TRAP-type transport system small permease protein